MKKLFASILALLLLAFCSLSVFASEPEKADLLIDKAELLDDSEEESIRERLYAISDEYGYDVVIVIDDTVGDSTPEYFAESYYTEGNYGTDEQKSGTILYISLWTRDWYIISNGIGEEILPNVYSIEDEFVHYLSTDDWYEGFNAFIDGMESRIDEHFNFPILRNAVIALIVAVIVALITVEAMRSKLKSVRWQNNARQYVREGSFKLTRSRDLYLYSTVTRVPRPKSSSGSRGGFSGGGGSRGGGKF